LGKRCAEVLERHLQLGGVYRDVAEWAAAVSEQLACGEDRGGVRAVRVLEQCGDLKELAADGGGAIAQYRAAGPEAARRVDRIGGLAQRMRERAAGTRSDETRLSSPREPAPDPTPSSGRRGG
jgi:hypothetical protein